MKNVTIVLICIMLMMRSKAEVISVTFEKGDAASCKIACLQKKVAEAGYGTPFGTYQIVFGMHFAKRNTIDSAMLVQPGDMLSFDTETREIVFTTLKGSQMIYSCVAKKLTSEIEEARPVLAVLFQSAHQQPCVCKIEAKAEDNSIAQNLSLSTPQDTSPLVVIDNLQLPTGVSENSQSLRTSCPLALKAERGDSVHLVVHDKMLYFKRSGVPVKERRKWRIMFTAIAQTLVKAPAETNELARSLLCEVNLAKYSIQKNRNQYTLTSPRMVEQKVEVTVKKKKNKKFFVVDYYKVQNFKSSTHITALILHLRQ